MATLTSPIIENCKEETFNKIDTILEKEKSFDLFEKEDKKNNYNQRSIFHKRPIKKDNFKLEVEFNETPQEIRRQRILYYQKKNRDASFNVGRGLLEEAFNSENEEEMEDEMEAEKLEEMEVEKITKKRYKVYRRYQGMLMLSEWMLEVPQDFIDKWIMVPCPIGKRLLLVASKGLTKAYTKKGIQHSVFHSSLPGGSPRTAKSSCTILDCIWVQDKNIYYVLDLLAWSNQEMINCEAEFRFYWLRSQLEELDDVKYQQNGINDNQILPLPRINCNSDFYESLENISRLFSLDGLLFYHKEAQYSSGRTPLVMWLKAYMLSEVLGINVPEPYDEKPDNYTDFNNHVLKVIQNEKKRISDWEKKKKQLADSTTEDME